IASFAEENFRIEVAFSGIIDEPVFQAVSTVASVDGRLVNNRILRWWNVAGRFLQHRVRNPEGNGRPVCGSSRDNTVIIVGKHLSFFESLPATRRATVPVGKSWAGAVEGFDDVFRLDGHFVLGSP